MFLIKKISEIKDDELKKYLSSITPYNNALIHYTTTKGAHDRIYNDKEKSFFTLESCKEVLKLATANKMTLDKIIENRNADVCIIMMTLQSLKEIGQYLTYSKQLCDMKYEMFYDYYFNLSTFFKYEHDNDSDFINQYLMKNKNYDNLIYINNILMDEVVLDQDICKKIRKKILFFVKDLIIFYNEYLEYVDKMIAYYSYVRYKLIE